MIEGVDIEIDLAKKWSISNVFLDSSQLAGIFVKRVPRVIFQVYEDSGQK